MRGAAFQHTEPDLRDARRVACHVREISAVRRQEPAPHEVMVRRPGLFNEAIGGFYRLTEAVAARRAGTGESDDAGGDMGLWH